MRATVKCPSCLHPLTVDHLENAGGVSGVPCLYCAETVPLPISATPPDEDIGEPLFLVATDPRPGEPTILVHSAAERSAIRPDSVSLAWVRGVSGWVPFHGFEALLVQGDALPPDPPVEAPPPSIPQELRMGRTHPNEVTTVPSFLPRHSVVVEVKPMDQTAKLLCFKSQQRVRVGREDGDIILPDHHISRVHGELLWRGDVLKYFDLRSTNGSFVGGVKISEIDLTVGMVIEFGESSLCLIAKQQQLLSLPVTRSVGPVLNRSARTVSHTPSKGPEAITSEPAIAEVKLSGQALTTFPNEVLAHRRLRWLDLSRNSLEQLPEEIGSLQDLEMLDVSHNDLHDLPRTLLDLKKLRFLHVQGNPRLRIPAEVTGDFAGIKTNGTLRLRTPASILQHYFKSRLETVTLAEAKLCVVGHERVGKTEIVRRLLPTTDTATRRVARGLEVVSAPFRGLYLQVWELRGGHRACIPAIFCGEHAACLLVVSGTSSVEADIEHWIDLLTPHCGESSVVVAIVTSGTAASSVNIRGLQLRYPAIAAIICVDLATWAGSERLADALGQLVEHVPTATAAVTNAWLAIRDKLRESTEPLLSIDRFREVCRSFGEHEREGQDRLLALLGTTGHLLPASESVAVLDPCWLADVLSGVMASRSVGASYVLGLSAVREVLSELHVPREAYSFVVELLCRAKLFVPFGAHGVRQEFIVDAFLDSEEPESVGSFAPATCLNFEYHYDLGTSPSRFIPALLAALPGQHEAVWRHGFEIGWEGCRGLLLADDRRNRLVVRVRGVGAQRRRLLAVVRATISKLHAANDVAAVEQVPVPDAPDLLIPYIKLRVLEETGILTIHEVVGTRHVEIDIAKVLNGVEFYEQTNANKVFVGFADDDEPHKIRLERHLAILQRQGVVASWADHRVPAGSDRVREVSRRVHEADILLLLVSSDLLSSEFLYGPDMAHMLDRHRRNEALVVPILIRDCDWRSTFVQKFQVLPMNEQAIALWPNLDSGWRDVQEGLRRMLTALRERRDARRLG